MATSNGKTYAVVDYEDDYVQPLLLAALKARLPPEVLVLISSSGADTIFKENNNARLLQWHQYESIDFDHLLANPTTSLANSYIIRKALIRKHYLSTTVAHWIAKNPTACLKDHVKPSVEFEVDYAEFLDDALDQADAWELRESWQRNLEREEGGKEWWILKPGMSERGQGIRLFSSQEELQEIFEEWDPPESDDEEDGETPALDSDATDNGHVDQDEPSKSNGIMSSHLRHFIAQPYIDPPLLLPTPHPSAGRKFHIRTYLLAVGALKLYVYKSMLALFAAGPYAAPGSTSASSSPNEDLGAHLTNTCLQTGEREGSVYDFWSLPQDLAGLPSWKADVFSQIQRITGEVFEAAARAMSIHFQPLPNAFEIFGLDFLVDADGKAWLLEINAFPDFKQTGDDLQRLVGQLMEEVIEVAVKPFFGFEAESRKVEGLTKVLDLDLGRR